MPVACDEQVIARVALDDKSQTTQESAATLVNWHLVSHDPVQPQLIEHIRDGSCERLVHQALSDPVTIKLISQKACLKSAPRDVREIAIADDSPLWTPSLKKDKSQGLAARKFRARRSKPFTPVVFSVISGRVWRRPRSKVLLILLHISQHPWRCLDRRQREQQPLRPDNGKFVCLFHV